MPRKAPPSSPAFRAVIAMARSDGRSLRQLAKDTGIPHKTLDNWVNGLEPAAFAVLDRLAGELGLEIIARASGR